MARVYRKVVWTAIIVCAVVLVSALFRNPRVVP
jgi:hypothetical protein